MNGKHGFKKPTIKDNGRAYVRLFQCFETPESWLDFLNRYTIQHQPFGVRRNGDCAVCVIDPATGDLAVLGLDIPNQITYHTFAAERSFWNERYASAMHRRHRTIEVGYDSPSKDEVVPR
ncbi:hypothetical protein [Burkholderia gladioli]|uniref:hypothetical protein n=1 Tax=Burkholderia gladioli TaxID=28095 RepID=UPI00163EAD19|nr:hypothetical protein [Burkholderia gladioli]